MAKTKREIILDNLDQIELWSAEGKTVRWIAQELGVGKTLLYQMMKEDREAVEKGGQSTGLQDSVKNGREQAVEKIECTMFNSACGFTRIEKKHAKVKRIIYNDQGRKAEEYEEMVEYEEERYYPPDATSAIFLLKNWAKYANEPVTNDLRKREIELKEKQVEANSW